MKNLRENRSSEKPIIESRRVYFRGKAYTAKKKHLVGSHRASSPEETWEKISPLAPSYNVTRIADITGLDRIGIPVTIATRPSSLTLSVSSGKGLSKVAAQVSGLMEAIELFSAENSTLPFFNLSYDDLVKSHNTLSLAKLPYRKSSLFSSRLSESWTLGWDLFEQQEIAIPLQSVTLDNRAIQNRSFQISSNGLASGNHFLEAITSGVYEVIERDAIACHLYASEQAALPEIRLASIPYPSVQELCRRLKEVEIKLTLSDCTVDTGVPVFTAKVFDLKFSRMSPIQGHGAHLDPEIAMIRAITEAIQGRGVVIAGSRDDIFAPSFEMSKNYNPQTSLQEEKDFCAKPSSITNYFEEDLHILMNKLKGAQINQLIVCDLTHPSLGVPVVRVFIPELEGPYSSIFRPGPRAKKFAALHKKNGTTEPIVGLHLPAGGLA